MREIKRKPEWLKARAPMGEKHDNVRELLKKYNLNTVCDEACCPNRGECFNLDTATFMILGRQCTRNCMFCAVSKEDPEPVNEQEPLNVAKGIKELKLEYVVITSVTRDDLPDGGAAHFASTIREIKRLNPEIKVEVLIPDLNGNIDDLKTIVNAKPDVIGHNVETVPSLYSKIRPMAEYFRSLKIIEAVKKMDKNIISKTGIMVGVGETVSEVESLFDDLIKVGCELITIGQYLAPTNEHYPIKEYIIPEQFKKYKETAEKKGFLYAASSPFTRSSHLAIEGYNAVIKKLEK
jgi:lipoyl synthase